MKILRRIHYKTMIFILFLLSLSGSVISCTEERQAENLVKQYFEYWNQKDIDNLMSLIADNPAIEVKIGQILSDKILIRAAFEDLFERADYTVLIENIKVKDNTVNYVYKFIVDSEIVESGLSEAIIENGKIKSEHLVERYK